MIASALAVASVGSLHNVGNIPGEHRDNRTVSNRLSPLKRPPVPLVAFPRVFVVLVNPSKLLQEQRKKRPLSIPKRRPPINNVVTNRVRPEPRSHGAYHVANSYTKSASACILFDACNASSRRCWKCSTTAVESSKRAL